SVRRRWRPTGSQFREEISDRIEIMIGPGIFAFVVFWRHAFDRQLQVLAIGIVNFWNAGSVIEYAAIVWRTGTMTEDAAGRMRKRDRIDLVPVPCFGAC